MMLFSRQECYKTYPEADDQAVSSAEESHDCLETKIKKKKCHDYFNYFSFFVET